MGRIQRGKRILGKMDKGGEGKKRGERGKREQESEEGEGRV